MWALQRHIGGVGMPNSGGQSRGEQKLKARKGGEESPTVEQSGGGADEREETNKRQDKGN